jgi:hypothetical protein
VPKSRRRISSLRSGLAETNRPNRELILSRPGYQAVNANPYLGSSAGSSMSYNRLRMDITENAPDLVTRKGMRKYCSTILYGYIYNSPYSDKILLQHRCAIHNAENTRNSTTLTSR